MNLETELLFESSKLAEFKVEISKTGPERVSLQLFGHLNKTMAEYLKVPWVFASDTTANDGMAKANLDKDIEFGDCELKLASEDGGIESFFPEKIGSWKIYRTPGGTWGVECKASMQGGTDSVLYFLRKYKDHGYKWLIRPRQGDLFEGGTRVQLVSAEELSSDDVDIDTPEVTPESSGTPLSAQDLEFMGLFEPPAAEPTSLFQEPCQQCGGMETHTSDCPFREPALARAADVAGAKGKRGRPKKVATPTIVESGASEEVAVDF